MARPTCRNASHPPFGESVGVMSTLAWPLLLLAFGLILLIAEVFIPSGWVDRIAGLVLSGLESLAGI